MADKSLTDWVSGYSSRIGAIPSVKGRNATVLVGALAAGGVFGSGATLLTGWLFAATLAAAAIDNFLLFPALFPPEDIKGPRAENLQLSPASEGAGRHFGLGEYIRTGPVYTWIGEVVEVERTTGGDGKKGGPEISNFTYYSDVAAEFNDGEITSLDRVWADGRIIYVNPDKPELATTTKTGTDISITEDYPGTGGPYLPTGQPSGNFGFTFGSVSTGAWCATLTSTSTSFTNFTAGENITISGFTHSPNNSGYVFARGTPPVSYYLVWRIVEIVDANTMKLMAWGDTSPTGSGTFNTNNYTDWYNECNTGAAGDSITLTAVSAAYRPDLFTSISIYTGTQTQTPNALIQALQGAASTPAFRGRAYFVLEQLNLSEFGNRLPQMQVQYSEQDDKPLSTAVSDLLVKAGLSTDNFDVTALAGKTVDGYAVLGSQEPRSALQPLMMGYNVAVQEDNDKFKFYFKENATEYAVSTERIGTREIGSPGQFATVDDSSRPTRIELKYVDKDNDLQAGAQVFRKVDTPEQGSVTSDLGIALSASTAQCIARRILWASWANSKNFATTLAPRYADLLPGDVITFSYNTYDSESNAVAADVRAFILRLTRGDNGAIEVEGVIEDPAVFLTTTCDADPAGGYTPINPATGGVGDMFISDLAPLSNDELTTPGFYRFACLRYNYLSFTGAVIYQDTTTSAGSASTFSTSNILGEVLGESTMGRSVPVHGNGTLADAQQGVIDRKNKVDVVLNNGSVASITDAELMDYGNLAILGNEILAFKTATSLGGNKYRLTNFLRGLKGTRCDQHSDGEKFCMINSAFLKFYTIPATAGSTGVSRNFKIVTSGQTLAQGEPYLVDVNGTPVNGLMYGRNAWASPICNVKMVRDGSNNITVRWQRTTRAWINGIAATRPLVEAYAQFSISIYLNGTITTPAAQVMVNPVSLSPKATTGYYYQLSATTQNAIPGLTAGDTVYFEIFQLSTSGFSGRFRERYSV